MDTREEIALVVHYKETILRFIECVGGLYYYDMAESDNSNTTITTCSYILQKITRSTIPMVKLKERKLREGYRKN